MSDTYGKFFEQATNQSPYAYQCRLAGGPDAPSSGDFEHGTTCDSKLIDIPTGLGKTAAVVLAWLWNRTRPSDSAAVGKWPRRLVYCLPMRTLVEQTSVEARKWIEQMGCADRINVHVLMGGEESGEWDIYPEREAILIGTQDMLLSRALNRGYGLSRARWPMHFGLLNNDSLWVLDETQLMGVGVRTSAQLEGLRTKIGTAIGCATWWSSATLDSRPLRTPDHPAVPTTHNLGPSDLSSPHVQRRIHASKKLSLLPFALGGDFAKLMEPYLEKLAAAVVEKHKPGETTIVILNRVDRAKGLFAALEKISRKQPVPRRLLVHSRFRPMERDLLSQQVREPGEKIIVATQAIEAGVDISSRTLITELAPWSSLVQRFGRCNRKGEFNDEGGADIFWINLEAGDERTAAELALPYTPEQFTTARSLLRQAETTGAAPSELAKLHTEEALPEAHVLRRKDLIDLFDTSPDLAGLDIDVGRYIRDGEDRDVEVYWRKLAEDELPTDGIAPQRRELVRVPIHGFKKFAEKNKSGIWIWSVLDGEWQPLRPDRISPGQIYLIDAVVGGYSALLGWTGEKSKDPFPLLTVEDQHLKTPRDGQDLDDESLLVRNEWQSLESHTAYVVAACNEKLQTLPEATPWAEALRISAKWHDVGKAHACFQEFIIGGRTPPPELQHALIAKSPWKAGGRHVRPHFRHELASSLAWLQCSDDRDPQFQSLVAYLIATHHGKIRLSLRAMPGEIAPPVPESPDQEIPLYARGIWQGDTLPPSGGSAISIEGFPSQGVALDLSCMRMGERDNCQSWVARVISLRDSLDLGVFRLAWLESILRAADAKASE